MTLEVEINGKIRVVSIEPVADAADRYTVTVDGKARVMDAREVDSATLSLIAVDDGSCEEVEIVESAVAGELLVRTRDGLLPVMVNGRRRRRASADVGGAAGEQRIVAPMPGKIIRILVAPGAEVKARQGVVVIEAMKMECELASPKAGHVKEIAVEVGASVEKGRLLAVVE